MARAVGALTQSDHVRPERHVDDVAQRHPQRRVPLPHWSCSCRPAQPAREVNKGPQGEHKITVKTVAGPATRVRMVVTSRAARSDVTPTQGRARALLLWSTSTVRVAVTLQLSA